MKRFFIFTGMMLATVCAQAQLRVYENGSIAIKTTETPVGDFTIGYAGNSFFNNSITANNSGLYVRRYGTPTISFNWWKAIDGYTLPRSNNFNIGVRGAATSSTILNSGRAYGIWGEAGNTTEGHNYGVFGTLYGNQEGAAIYGTAEEDNGVCTWGRYAGYFNGCVYVTRYIYGTLLSQSAASSNTSVQTITNDLEQSVTDKMTQLSTIQYNLTSPAISRTTTLAGDTISSQNMSMTEMQSFQKKHFGLVAEQLQQVYPDLVYENQQGELCINYIEMIPLLVQSIKELKAEIATLQGGNNGGVVVMSRAIGGATSVEEATALTIPMLKQNNPNPFTENTVIEYSLPETVQTANIYIYDMNGSQIEQIALAERGEASITVNGGQLSAGMYLYSLIADGKVIDTKRMILTK